MSFYLSINKSIIESAKKDNPKYAVRYFSPCAKDSRNFTGKRTFLTTSIKRRQWLFIDCNSGSVTIEAAAVIGLFLLVIYMLGVLLITVHFQKDYSAKLFQTVDEVGKEMYSYEKVGLGHSLITTVTYGKMNTSKFREYVNNSVVYKGSTGMSYLQSDLNYDERDGVILCGAYQINLSGIIGEVQPLKFRQAICFRPWVGETISHEEQEKQVVYVTKTGKAYHLTRDCSYLKIVLKEVKQSDIPFLRNDNGQKYRECEICARNKEGWGMQIYVSSDGECYHSNRLCSTLMRSVEAITIDKIEGRTLCTRCKKNAMQVLQQ